MTSTPTALKALKPRGGWGLGMLEMAEPLNQNFEITPRELELI